MVLSGLNCNRVIYSVCIHRKIQNQNHSFSPDQAVTDELAHHQPVYEDLMTKGQEVLLKQEPGADRNQLERRLCDLTSRLNNVTKGTAERQKHLDRLVPVVLGYVELRTQFTEWLSGAEKELFNLALSSANQDLAFLLQKQSKLKVSFISILRIKMTTLS